MVFQFIISLGVRIQEENKIFQIAYKSFATSNDPVTVTFTNGVQTITMCNPKKRNVLSSEMMHCLTTSIISNENNPELRAIIIAAEGPVFSSGHDLKELVINDHEANSTEKAKKVFQLASKLMCSIIESPVPVIAKIDGLAAAAGCQLVAQCDMAFCTEKSTFSTPGAQFGVFCSTPGIPLARCVPKMTALHMLFTGLPLNSALALSSGLVTKVCPSLSELDRELDLTCEAINSKSRAIIAEGKRFYYRQIQVDDIKVAYGMGEKQMVEHLVTADGREGVRSFVEKRIPQWIHGNQA